MHFNQIRIVLGGPAGSGKTTIGKLLAQKLNIEFQSMGNKSRLKASQKGMSLAEYQNYMEVNPEIEKQDDKEFIKEMKLKKSYVLDYRMGFHFLRKAISVYLDIKPENAAKRVKDREGNGENFQSKSVSDIAENLKMRNRIMKERFLKLYGVDCTDSRNFDLYIGTDRYNADEVVSIILKMLKNKHTCTVNWKEGEMLSMAKPGKSTVRKIVQFASPKRKFGEKKNFWRENGYDCEKLKFKTLKAAFEGIKQDDEDGRTLRPYKCERCDFFHLTHKAKRHYNRPTIKKIRPSDVVYKIPIIKASKRRILNK